MKYLIITDKNKGVCSGNEAATLEQAQVMQVKLKELYNNRAVITEDIGLEANLAIIDYVAETVTWDTDKDTADKLAVAKSDKLQAISTRASEELDKGYTVDGQTYSISAESINAMQVKALESNDYNWHSKTYVKKMFVDESAFSVFIMLCYARSEAIAQNRLRLKGLVTQASDIDVLNAIDIEGGWV